MSELKPPVPPPAAPRRAASAPLRLVLTPGPRRRFLVIAIVSISVAAGWTALWRHVRDHVLAGEQYHLRMHQIEITPRPAWIRADVRAEAVRDGSLEGPLSILDDDLTLRVAKAFELHPWVAKVKRVAKHHPARVTVELEYRRPVAMIAVPGGLYAIDNQGIVLPSDDFSPVEAVRYPRLANFPGAASPVAGTAWIDERVVGAARIGEQLLNDWPVLKLHRLEPLPESGTADGTWQYQLISRSDARIIWGHAPGSEGPSELPSTEKLVLLRRAVEQGALTGPKELDLRQTPSQLSAPERTARGPEVTK